MHTAQLADANIQLPLYLLHDWAFTIFDNKQKTNKHFPSVNQFSYVVNYTKYSLGKPPPIADVDISNFTFWFEGGITKVRMVPRTNIYCMLCTNENGWPEVWAKVIGLSQSRGVFDWTVLIFLFNIIFALTRLSSCKRWRQHIGSLILPAHLVYTRSRH